MLNKLILVISSLFLIGCGGSDGGSDKIASIETLDDGSYVVNLNANSNGEDNPIHLTLEEGDYTITPISAHYNAWLPWSSIDNCYTDERCVQGWSNQYQYVIDENVNTAGESQFKTPELALSSATQTTFFLGSDSEVSFLLSDNIYDDNQGGMSLKIEKSIIE